MGRWPRTLLLSCFFVSGATGLVLEVVWSKQLSYLLGNTLQAVSAVVAVYMGGLGLGALTSGALASRLRRPVLLYAGIQATVGVLGILSVPALRKLEPLLGWLFGAMGTGGAFSWVRLAVVFAALALPVFLMGMTLPLLAGALRSEGAAGRSLAGILYGINTLGAVLGTWAAGFVLLPAMGLFRTAVAAGVADLFVAGFAWGIHRSLGAGFREPLPDALQAPDGAGKRNRGGSQRRGRVSAWSGRQRALAGLFLVSGFAAMALEVAWFRLVGLVAGPSTYAFSSLLALFLFGIGCGSLAWSSLGRRLHLSGLGSLAGMEILLGLWVIGQFFFLNRLPLWFAATFREVAPRGGEAAFFVALVAISAGVALVPCLAMGAVFPAAVRALREMGPPRGETEGVGYLYGANTFGSISGSLATGFWLLPEAGIWSTLAGSACLSVGVGILALLLGGARNPARWAFGALFALVALFGLREAPALDRVLFNLGGYRYLYLRQDASDLAGTAGEARLVFFREGLQSPTAVLNLGGEGSLRVSGKADASTNSEEVMTNVLLGHCPMLLTADARRVGVVGYGSGATAGAILTHPGVERLDIMEFEPAVLAADPYFRCINGGALEDGRSRVILEDARVHLVYASDTYDVIVAEPSNPWMAGVSNLFTVDFYKSVRSRLSPGGTFCQWIQMYEISEEAFRTVLASLLEVFPHAVAFRGSAADAIFLAADRPIGVPAEELALRVAHPAVGNSLARVGIGGSFEFLAHYRAGGATLRAYASETPDRNTDDNLWLEHRAIRDLVRNQDRGNAQKPLSIAFARLGEKCRLAGLRELVPGLPEAPFIGASVRYFGRTPFAVDDLGVVSDPFREEREVFAEGLRGEVSGDPELLRALDASLSDSGREREALLFATRTVYGDLPEDPRARFERLHPAVSPVEWWAPGQVELGNTLAMAGFLKPAADYYRKALGDPSSPEYYTALLFLGRVEFDLHRAGAGDLGEAERLTREAVAWNPYRHEGYIGLAELALFRGDPGAAQRALRDGLVYCPGESLLEEALARSTGPARGP